MGLHQEQVRIRATELEKKIIDLTVAVEQYEQVADQRRDELEEVKMKCEQAEAALLDIKGKDVVKLRSFRSVRHATDRVRSDVQTVTIHWVTAEGQASKARRALADMQSLYDDLQKELAKPDNTVLSFKKSDTE